MTAGWLGKIVDLVLPPRCLLTGEAVEGQGLLSPDAWRQLSFLGDPCCAACGYPFEFEVEKGTVCPSCLASPPPYAAARAAVAYDEASREVILRFKHGDETRAAPVFAGWMVRAAGPILAPTDMIVPVPLHPWRLLRRRYNQAALLAQAIGRQAGKEWHPRILRRVRATPTQGRLGARERYRNVRNAFAVAPESADKIKGRTILLVDDVYTSGATVHECTRALLKAGAAAVNVLTLARVVKAERFD